MNIIHENWFVSLYPILVFGLGFLAGRFLRDPLDAYIAAAYRSGWDSGRDAAYQEIKSVMHAVMDELEAPNVLIQRRRSVFLSKQAN